MKKLAVLIMSATLALCLAGCSSEVSKLDDEIANLGEITLESYAVLEDLNQRYEALEDEDKAKVENYAALEEANDAYSKLIYSEIVKKIEEADKLTESHFAQYYDLADFNKAKEGAAAAIGSSDESSYTDVYSTLVAEVSEFQAFIDEKIASSYSIQAADGDYPFMVEESKLPNEWTFWPAYKHTSSHPSTVSSFMDYTDVPPYAHFFFDAGNSFRYSYEISQIDTISIPVRNKDGEIVDACVNTKIQFSRDVPELPDPDEEMNERPCYLFVDQGGYVNLALESYDGESCYIPYVLY